MALGMLSSERVVGNFAVIQKRRSRRSEHISSNRASRAGIRKSGNSCELGVRTRDPLGTAPLLDSRFVSVFNHSTLLSSSSRNSARVTFGKSGSGFSGDLMKLCFGVSLYACCSMALCMTLFIDGCKKSSPTIKTAPGADWTTYGRTHDEQRFSPLNQINEQNIGQLGLLWDRELGTTRGLEATPLVSNGVIYTTGEWSVAYALDVRSGEIL